MKIIGISLGYVLAIGLVTTAVVGYTWEDHPDIEDHKDTDRLYKLACEQTGYYEYEREQLEKESQEALLNYKASKFKKKAPKND